MIGLLIGWSWRLRWTGLVFLGLRRRRRLWLAFSAFSICRTMWFNFRGKSKATSAVIGSGEIAEPSNKDAQRVQDVVTEADLDHFVNLTGEGDGEMEWQSLMEKTTPTMAYKAWCHDPETGPTVYCCRTVFEDATPELVRDFFWDDEFRPKWDPMLVHCKILEECPVTGTMIAHWIKKMGNFRVHANPLCYMYFLLEHGFNFLVYFGVQFPFFCSDREYIIGRRIWEAGKTYYCVTKGVPYPSLPKRDKPRRVEHYFSSWIIKPVESRKGDGQLSACEVTLVHYEDMGIPKDVAKLGVRHGMWCTVKKLHSGMRRYQNARKSPETSLSQCARLAGITTKIPSKGGSTNYLEVGPGEEDKNRAGSKERRENNSGIDWKWTVIGGTVALVCGIHTGVVGKSLLLGAGQRFSRRR